MASSVCASAYAAFSVSSLSPSTMAPSFGRYSLAAATRCVKSALAVVIIVI